MTIGFFFSMAWKSALIAGIALGLAWLLRSRAAADRVALLRVAVCLLLLLPALSLLLPGIELELGSAASVPLLLADAPPAAAHAAAGAAANVWDDPSPLVALLYAGGLAMIAAHLAAGLWTLRRWTAEAEPALRSEWTEALDRARGPGGEPDVNLLVSTEPPSPMSWGWRRPVILLDHDSYAEPGEADAVMSHEVAHVVRGDWLTLMLARVAVALFWFNPLVWLVERAMMQHAEEAADCEAIRRVDPARYAQTLLNYAQLANGAPLPANSIASGPLGRRVNAILSGRLASVPAGSAWSFAAIAATIALAAPVAALELVAPKPPTVVAPPAYAAIAAAPVSARQALAAMPPAPSAPAEPLAAPAAKATHAPVRSAATVAEVAPLPSIAPLPRVAAVPAVPRPPAVPAAPLPPAAPAAPYAFAPYPVATVQAVVAQDWDSDRIEQRLRHANDQIRRATELALAQQERYRAQAQRDAERAAERAQREAERAGERAQRDADRIAAQARTVAARQVALSMEQGARGLEAGAAGMESGAARMEEEAKRLRDRGYRERKIAEAAQRGRHLTHDELIASIEGLQDGAESMRDGARDMREQAQEMRQACTETTET